MDIHHIYTPKSVVILTERLNRAKEFNDFVAFVKTFDLFIANSNIDVSLM